MTFPGRGARGGARPGKGPPKGAQAAGGGGGTHGRYHAGPRPFGAPPRGEGAPHAPGGGRGEGAAPRGRGRPRGHDRGIAARGADPGGPTPGSRAPRAPKLLGRGGNPPAQGRGPRSPGGQTPGEKSKKDTGRVSGKRTSQHRGSPGGCHARFGGNREKRGETPGGGRSFPREHPAGNSTPGALFGGKPKPGPPTKGKKSRRGEKTHGAQRGGRLTRGPIAPQN